MAIEQWEVMSVTAIGRPGDDWQLTVVEPPNYQSMGRDPDTSGQGDQGMKLIQHFGQEGWHLVQVDTVHQLIDNNTQRTYWLKRRVG